jgi:DNA polymerase-3 subunit delta
MLYVLHGEDEFTCSEMLVRWKEKLGDATTASLNTTVLDGRKVTLPDLVETCDAVPFMGKRRLVIVEDFWSRFESPKRRRGKGEPRALSAADTALIQALVEYLPRLPETTRLIFVESQSLTAANPVSDVLPQDNKRIHVKEFRPPSERDLPRWIQDRIEAKEGEISPQAAQELARFVGTELRQLDQELDKLLAHVNYERAVTAQDVHAVVSAQQPAGVFDLVDAIGMRQGERAMRYLHELLDAGAAPMYLLTMIERQFRILLQVKELQAQGATLPEIKRATGIGHRFVIQKGSRQARNFSMERLEAIYAHLADVEQHIKTGKIGDLLALDLLVAQLCA